MADYLTPAETGFGEYTEKKSRFLGEAFHAETEEEAAAELSRIRKKYYDARHTCYAWVLGETGSVRKASDDGEPSGTAGQPILKVIDGAGCTDILIAVTRYFGGTLLGTGGLVRSYTAAAKAALENAQIVRMCLCGRFAAQIEYGMLDRILYVLRQKEIEPEVAYTDKVTLTITAPMDDVAPLRQQIIAMTGGSAKLGEIEEGYYPLKTT